MEIPEVPATHDTRGRLLRVVCEKEVERAHLGERGERCFDKDNVKGGARDSKVRIHTENEKERWF